ncbi:MAG: S8 family serine peptidase [Bdellovibrionales bacterium]|nr:S8 family serine peptidase [Bdellovibrionales bacterium]
MKNTRGLTWLLLAVLPLLYFNCSSSKSGGGGSDGGGGNYDIPYVPSEAINSFQVGTDGTVKVWQDKELSYSPTDGAPGVYTALGLPAWASFDTTTGRVRGVPRRLSDGGSTFTISKVGGATYGPFTITIVGDAYKEQQWHLINTGQTAYALTPGIADQDIHYTESVKSNLLGGGLRIAISDSGTYISHPDLIDNVLVGESRNYGGNYSGNWLGDPSPAVSSPEDAHGTAVAGLAAAKGWNGIGGRGSAPEARFAAFAFLSAQDKLASTGMTVFATNDQFAGNFDIFNFSWGDLQCAFSEYDQSYADKLATGIATQRGGRGSIYVMAAGNGFINDLSDCYYVTPGSDYVLGNSSFSELNTTPFTINVAAVAANGMSASYSTPGSAIWIASTGGEYGWSQTKSGQAAEYTQPALITTDYPGCNNGLSSLDKDKSDFAKGTNNPGCSYINTMNGTSGAAPIVSGVAAILLQANPNLTWRDVKYILAKTAQKVHSGISAQGHPMGLNLSGHTYEMPWITNAAGFNFHNWYGFGRIHVDNAVAMAKNYVSPLGTFKSTNWKHDSGSINVAVPDNSAAGLNRGMMVTENMKAEAVQLRISISSCAGDIGLELTSPSGTKSILMNINSKIPGGIDNHVFLSNAFYGETITGTWALKVIDGKSSCNSARLTNWKLNFYGY